MRFKSRMHVAAAALPVRACKQNRSPFFHSFAIPILIMHHRFDPPFPFRSPPLVRSAFGVNKVVLCKSVGKGGREGGATKGQFRLERLGKRLFGNIFATIDTERRRQFRLLAKKGKQTMDICWPFPPTHSNILLRENNQLMPDALTIIGGGGGR